MARIKTDLTIVIPALREEKRIGKTLDKLALLLKKNKMLSGLEIEVLVVAATSSDKTHDVVLSRKSAFKKLDLLKPGKPVGKGRDVQYGMLRAKGDAVIFMDADLATPLKYLPLFYDAYKEGAPVVVATRNLRIHHPDSFRRVVSNLGNLLFRIAGGVWIEDSQCGFKLFSKDAAKLCFSKLTIMGWGFDMEVLAIARANNLKIVSYRVNDWVSVPEGAFSDGLVKNSVASLQELARICWNRLKGNYKERRVPAIGNGTFKSTANK